MMHAVPATQETLLEVSLSNIVKVYPKKKKKVGLARWLD